MTRLKSVQDEAIPKVRASKQPSLRETRKEVNLSHGYAESVKSTISGRTGTTC